MALGGGSLLASRASSPRSASEAVSFVVDDEEDEVVAAVTSLLDSDAAELAVEVLPVSAVAADADGEWQPPLEEEEEERRVVVCGRTPEPRGFFGCRLPLGHAGRTTGRRGQAPPPAAAV